MRSLILAAAAICAPLTASAFAQAEEAVIRPLFDGQSLAGWEGDHEFWRAEKGVIVGESTSEKPLDHNVFLTWSQGTVDDFVFRVQFKLTGSDKAAANSGIQFRSAVKPDGHVFGYQADIDLAGQWIGACYDELGRGVLAKRGERVVVADDGRKQTSALGSGAELLKAFHENDWNDYEIKGEGSRITITLNGQVTAQIDDQQTAERDLSGLLALQLHAGPPQRVEFRNAQLQRLPLAEGRKKVVFVAGTPSHGPREHEHNAGCLLLSSKLEEAAARGLPVLTEVYLNGWPHDPSAFDNADTVVFYCDGGEGHFINSHREEFQRLVDRGVGLCCIHYAVEVPKGPSGEKLLQWIGGYFEPDWSVNPHWTAHFDKLPDHPITRGVAPFEINDEWYYHMRFPAGLQNVTPILTDLPPKDSLSRPDGPHSGNPAVREAVLDKHEPQHVAWAIQRPDGQGRGFGFTGGHFHRNWQDDNFRKIVLNAIVWTAGLEVPARGVESTTPTDSEMEANLDPKGQAQSPAERRSDAVKTRLAVKTIAQKRTIAESGSNAAKPVFSSPVVTSDTAGHAVDIQADITGASQLFLVVTDGGNGFSCDWADWVEPRLSGPGGDQKLTELKWKSARADWGEVRVNQRVDGGELRVNGQPVAEGIGAHAVSVIAFDLPAGFTRFTARGGLDNGGTDQANGTQSSVQFHVFTQPPPAALIASAVSGGRQSSHEAADAVAQLDVHPDLQCTLFASEPMLANPTNIEVDHLGRVWVCEVINYRRFRNTDQPERKEGDRILILEDTDHDGRADKSTTFYQGRDIDSAHGILVLPTLAGPGTKALVSARDAMFFLIDDDGDLKADRKEILFSGIGGVEHDHGIHAAVFGPDGKLYFNFGNEGHQVKDKDGRPIFDKAGNEVNAQGHPYRQGMAFRCDVDGTHFETLGWNFRNNWELAVDSFGTVWQSDNDDDGNRGVRINYVMEYGNFGYQDELTGAAWTVPRTGWAAEIPRRHWHQNDPGVIPNLLLTGAGSPTGICVYEGSLLPEVFRGNLIHCDAGPNIVRAYTLRPDGAGYSAESINVLDGARDQWFRPTDVCVCPDGSLMISDWYDPGVGGHRMEDVDHGRLFRVSPPSTPYTVPSFDLGNPNGAVAALQSGNVAWQYLAWQALSQMGAGAQPALSNLLKYGSPRHRARALWLLGKLELPDDQRIAILKSGLQDADANIRVTAVRLARQLQNRIDIEELKVAVNLQDPSPAVRRELLIAMREIDGVDAPQAWAQIALQYDGQDRWMLEALGLGADHRWDDCLAAWMEAANGQWNTPTGRDIVWRSRGSQTPRLLAEIISNPQTSADQLPRYFRAFDFLPAEEARPALTGLALQVAQGDAARKNSIATEALSRLPAADQSSPQFQAALDRVLSSAAGTPEYVTLVAKFNLNDRYPSLLEIAQHDPESQVAVEVLRTLFEKQQARLVADALQSGDPVVVSATLRALTTAADNRSLPLLLDFLRDARQSIELRRDAVRALGSFRGGSEALSQIAARNEFDESLKDSLAAALHGSAWEDIKQTAAKLFPSPPGKDDQPLPPLAVLLNRKGDVANGRIVYHTTGTCATCHVVNGLGREVGPNLSEIGKKLTRQAMFESILYPSAGISHNYESWTVATADGNVLTGLITSETPEELTIKDAKGILRTVKQGDVDARRKSDVSLMPADLQKVLSEQDLVDVIEYLTTLTEAQPAAAVSR